MKFKSFGEQLNKNKCERCRLPFAYVDLKDIGIPGINGYKVCKKCLKDMPEATRAMINDVCAEWA